ncbi:MAG TPA: hypothetical protein VI382_09375, partial [Candidatus Manganitrophaceae bacterium]|nr:hypothetical protein [Candidatus Manganitrophaceae bacterium]
MSIRYNFLVLILLLLGSSPAWGASDYLDELIQQSIQKGLAEKRYWRLLLHYEDGLFGGSSDADGASFFLDPHGKT